MRETLVTSNSLRKVRRMRRLGQDRLITLLHKQGTEIRDQYMIIERKEEFYTNSAQSTIIHTATKDAPAIISC